MTVGHGSGNSPGYKLLAYAIGDLRKEVHQRVNAAFLGRAASICKMDLVLI